MQVQELQIPTAWGHIAVKAWGSLHNEIVIALHGLLDNAASFDALIPLLTHNFCYLCVDLPGHGLSSHFPPDFPLYVTNYLQIMRIVVDHFKRDKYILLGHSLGGRISALFTQIFPNLVSKIIILDGGYATPVSPQEYISAIKESYNVLAKIASNSPKRLFSYKDIIEKIRDGRLAGSLTFETAEQLGKRMIKKVGDDRYEFTFDRRLPATIYPNYNKEYIEELLDQYPIRCPALSVYSTDTQDIVVGHSGYTNFFSIPNFEVKEIVGHHHSHHTNPEMFAPILTRFLLQGSSKL